MIRVKFETLNDAEARWAKLGGKSLCYDGDEDDWDEEDDQPEGDEEGGESLL